MPFVDIDGLRCHYRLDGRDDRPVLMLAHSLGLDLGMWDEQLVELTAHVRVLRYDLRGHGATTAPAGDYTIAQLGRDAIGLMDAIGLARVSFCGVSIGGMIGQWLGAHHGDRLDRLVLANTSPRVAEPAGMEARRKTVLARGMAPIIDTAMNRFFTPALLSANPPRVASARRAVLATDPVGTPAAARRSAIRTCTTSSIAFRCPRWSCLASSTGRCPGRATARCSPSALRERGLCDCPPAHLSNLGAPRAFLSAVLQFLVGGGEGTVEAGTPIRRAILGDAHVDRSVAGATDFTRAFVAFITRTAWGSVWTRPGLDHRTRRLLVLAITASLGPLGGVSPARPHRPRRGPRGHRHRGGAPDRRRLRRHPGRKHRVPHRRRRTARRRGRAAVLSQDLRGQRRAHGGLCPVGGHALGAGSPRMCGE